MTIVLRPKTGAALRRRLTEVVVRVLNASRREGSSPVTRERVMAESFAALGMDSLAAAELTTEIEDDLGLELSPSDVFMYSNIESLAGFIEREGIDVDPARRDYTPPEGDGKAALRMRQMP